MNTHKITYWLNLSALHKIILLLFPLFALILTVNAQPTVFNWANSFGNVNDDKGNCIKVDGFGNVYTIGNFNDSVDFDPGSGSNILISSGYSDVFISKNDASGNFIWARSFGGSVHDNGTSIAVDDSGNVYSTGSFANTVDFDPGPGIFNLTSAGGLDVFVSKLDATGNLIWAVQMGGSQISSIGGDEGKSVAVDALGNLYITGRFEYTGDFDPGPGLFNLSASGTECDIFVCKLSNDGNFIWAKKWGANANGDWVNAISVNDSAQIYTTGSFYSTIDFDPGAGIFNMNPSGLAGVFISKLDSTGNFIWARQFSKQGGFVLDVGSLTVDNQGNIFSTGTFSGSVDFNPGTGTTNLTSGSGSNAFVVKLTPSGNLIWAKAFGGTGEVNSIGLSTDIYGCVYTTGWFNDNNPNCDFDPGSGIYKLTAAGYLDVFLCKLDGNGNFLWAKGMGSVAEDVGLAITTDFNSNVITTGYFSSTADFDPDTNVVHNLVAVASTDIFIQKLGQTGAGINDVTINGMLEVFPNPTERYLTITLPETLIQGIFTIYSVYGTRLYTESFISKEEIRFDGNFLIPGIYLVEIQGDKTNYVRKIMRR